MKFCLVFAMKNRVNLIHTSVRCFCHFVLMLQSKRVLADCGVIVVNKSKDKVFFLQVDA